MARKSGRIWKKGCRSDARYALPFVSILQKLRENIKWHANRDEFRRIALSL